MSPEVDTASPGGDIEVEAIELSPEELINQRIQEGFVQATLLRLACGDFTPDEVARGHNMSKFYAAKYGAEVVAIATGGLPQEFQLMYRRDNR